MGFNSDFIDSLKSSFSFSSLENYYNEKLIDKCDTSYTSISGYFGDDILRMELYLINYVENLNTLNDFDDLFSMVKECFHNISVKHFHSDYFENDDVVSVSCYSLLDTDYISQRIKYLDHFKSKDSNQGLKLFAWNNHLSYLYFIFKHLDGLEFHSHCNDCKNLSNILETSSIQKITVFFSLMNKPVVLETIFNHVFDNIAKYYWNHQLLLLSYSNLVVNRLVNNAINSYKIHDQNDILNDILQSFLLNSNNYLNLKFLHTRTFLKILGSYAMYLSLNYSDLSIISGEKNTFSNIFMSIILNNIVKASNSSAMNNMDVNYGELGLKNQAFSEFFYLKIFIESFMKSFSDQINKRVEISEKLSEINTFLDYETYDFIINLKFKPTVDSKELLNLRTGVVLLYMIALHNQIANIRLKEVAYMRLLYSLPWSQAMEFCISDQQLKYILMDFKRVVMECFGIEIFICNCLHLSTTHILNDFTANFVQKYNRFNSLERYYYELFLFSTFLSNSLFMFSEEADMSQINYFGTRRMYNTISNNLFMNKGVLKEINNTDFEPQMQDQVPRIIEWKWFSHYLRLSYIFNKSTCYLAVLDCLINRFIFEDFSENYEKLNLDDIFTSNYSLEPSLDHQRGLSSNFLSLNQNPLNLILRIPVPVLLHLFSFRFFGNLLILFLSKLDKYIYEGFSSFLASTTLQIDLFQLSALQSVSLINIVMELCKLSGKGTIKQFRNLILLLLSKNTNCYELLSTCCSPNISYTRFFHDLLSPEVSLSTSVDNYSYFLRLCHGNLFDWDKTNINLNKDTTTFQKSLDPSNKKDIALFHLYNIHMLAIELSLPKENYQSTSFYVQIENVLKVFLEFVKNNTSIYLQNNKISGSELPMILRSSMSFIVKLNYLYPALINKTTATISNILDNNQINSEVKFLLEELIHMFKTIEYNQAMVSNKDKKN